MSRPQVTRIRAAAAGLLACALLAGCNGAPGPTQTPTPTPTVTPSVSATPTQDELFEEAAAVYREYLSEFEKLESAESVVELPQAMAELMTPEYQQRILDVFRTAQKLGTRRVPGEPSKIISIAALPRPEWEGAAIRTTACVDSREVSYRKADGSISGTGALVRNTTTFVASPTGLRISANAATPGHDCAAS